MRSKVPNKITSEHVDEIVNLVETIVCMIVDNAETVTITPTVSENKTGMIIEINVDPDDMPFLLGRDGQNIGAIDRLTRAACARLGVDCHVNVLERHDMTERRTDG